MACTKNRSKIWADGIFVFFVITIFMLPNHAWGAFASQFSLTVGEGYSDNIFFTKQKEHDFATIIVPRFSLLYAPEGQVTPTLSLSVSPYGQIFARHSELSNFGENVVFNGAYTYRHSPQLSFYMSNDLQRLSETRALRLTNEGFLQAPVPEAPPPPSAETVPGSARNLSNFITGGDQLTNFFALQSSYLYRPDVSFTGGYTNTYTNFIDQGGNELFQTVGARGIYNWRRDHNLHAGYFISVLKDRDGDTNVVHNFDIGDAYFTNYKLQLTPTLSLAASTGISFNIGDDGPRVANNTNVTITKLWETATLSAGVQKGLTPSYGVSGISDTTSVFTNFVMRLSEKFSVNSGVEFSLFDTDDVNFKTFQGTLGLQYWITSWLSSALSYNFRWIDSGSGASDTDLLTRGVVNANTVLLTLTSNFDLWPNIRLTRSNMSSSTLAPVLRTPFAIATPSASPSPVPGP
jgi:hypothetical protein